MVSVALFAYYSVLTIFIINLGIQSPRLSIFNRNLPSSRKISTMIHRDKNRSVPTITLMFMQWGQFLDHDVTSTATSRAFNNSVPRCCLPGSTGLLPPEFMVNYTDT